MDKDNEVSFRYTELHILCHFLDRNVAFCIAADLGQFVETLHVIPPSFQDVYISSQPTVCKSQGQYHMQSICQTNSEFC